MSRGKSGRIVIDIETDLKNRLHAHVALEGRTLKEWFMERAVEYVEAMDRKSRQTVGREGRPAGKGSTNTNTGEERP